VNVIAIQFFKKSALVVICFVFSSIMAKTFYMLVQCWLNGMKKFLIYIFLGKLSECPVEPDSTLKGYSVPEIESQGSRQWFLVAFLGPVLSHPACGII